MSQTKNPSLPEPGLTPAVQPAHKAFFLVGPTAVGKTSVGQYLAERNGSDILSADSMLVYKDMDIGTAKPTAAERENVTYWGMDMVEPSDTCSVGAYLEHAARAFTSGKPVLVVGGTGLYVKCLLEGLAALPPADPRLRNELEQLYREKGLETLQEKLKTSDPARYDRLKDKKNPRRLVRALELAALSAADGPSWKGPSNVPLVGLKMDSARLYDRIRQRVVRMYRDGLIEEVRRLKERYRLLSKTALQAIGYAEALAVLDGQYSQKEAVELTTIRTRRLAKRQMTWFRRQANVQWLEIEIDAPIEETAGKVKELWKRYGETPLSI